MKSALKLQQDHIKGMHNALEVLMTPGTVEGSCVDSKTQKLRMEITRAFMCVGAPLTLIDGLSVFFNRWDLNVGTTSRHLRENIPFIAMSEKLKIQEEFMETAFMGLVSMAIDGCLHHGAEVCSTVSRWINSFTFQPVQRLVHLGYLESSLDHMAIISELFKSLEKLERDCLNNVKPTLVSVNHDRVSANYAAVRKLINEYSFQLVGIGCFPHTIDNAGKQFHIPLLRYLQKLLNAMLKNSAKVKLLFAKHLRKQLLSCNNTRWWSRFEQLYTVYHAQSVLPAGLHSLDIVLQVAETAVSKGYCKETATKIVKLLNDKWKRANVEVMHYAFITCVRVRCVSHCKCQHII